MAWIAAAAELLFDRRDGIGFNVCKLLGIESDLDKGAIGFQSVPFFDTAATMAPLPWFKGV